MSLTTRADLARFLSECKGRPKSEVIDDLYAMMGELGVQIRHDDQTPHDFDDEDAQVPHAPGAAVCRLLLSCGRRASASAAQREFGGLVIDTRTWAIIAAPPLALNPRPVAAVVDARLAAGDYDVYRVNDGTVVTLYNCEPAHPCHQLGPVWSMATSNGYDVSPLRWMGPLTFAEVFFDLATRLYPAFVAATGARLADGRLAFDRLDPAATYVVGFRHHNFHPLRADSERIWLIQSSAGDVAAVATALGLPTPAPVPLAALSRVTGTPPVVQPPTVASLAASCANALEEALALVAMAGGLEVLLARDVMRMALPPARGAPVRFVAAADVGSAEVDGSNIVHGNPAAAPYGQRSYFSMTPSLNVSAALALEVTQRGASLPPPTQIGGGGEGAGRASLPGASKCRPFLAIAPPAQISRRVSIASSARAPRSRKGTPSASNSSFW
jgi:hypothetical protein